MFYGRENANYIHANRYTVAAAQNLPQQSGGCCAGRRFRARLKVFDVPDSEDNTVFCSLLNL